MVFNQRCPKCQEVVTRKDHMVRNIEPAVKVAGPPAQAPTQMQLHWQHRVCSR